MYCIFLYASYSSGYVKIIKYHLAFTYSSFLLAANVEDFLYIYTFTQNIVYADNAHI